MLFHCNWVVLCSFGAMLYMSPLPQVLAQVGNTSGFVNCVFDGGFGGPAQHNVEGFNPGSSLPFSAAPPLQYFLTALGSGANLSTAQAGFGVYSNPTTALMSIAAGTGIGQSAPDGNNSPAQLGIISTGRFYVNGPWGPLVDFYSLPLAGNISAPGDYVDVTVSAQFTETQDKTTQYLLTGHYHNDTPGPFQGLLTGSITVPGFDSFKPGQQDYLDMYVQIVMTVFDPNGPAGISAPQGMTVGPLPIPEPSTFALAAFGLIGLAAWGWRRRR